MSEPDELLHQLKRLRFLIEVPTKLSKKAHKEARAKALHLGDNCWFCVGWYSAQPEIKPGIAATTHRDILKLIDLLETNAIRLQRKRGRPKGGSQNFVDLIIGIRHAKDNPEGRSLKSFIKDAMKKGHISSTTTPDGHAKRIQRIMKDK